MPDAPNRIVTPPIRCSIGNLLFMTRVLSVAHVIIFFKVRGPKIEAHFLDFSVPFNIENLCVFRMIFGISNQRPIKSQIDKIYSFSNK